MDLNRPADVLFGEERTRVLQRLSVLADGASGRRIHELSGVRSLRTTQRILHELVAAGLVDVRHIGSANEYSLNRHHVLWGPVEQLLATPSRLETAMAKILSETLHDRGATTALYGSFARGEAGTDSDVDVLVIWDDDEHDESDATELLDTASRRIEQLTGNHAQLFPLSRDELARLVERGDPLIDSLRRDARQLTPGADLRRLLRTAG
jgi:predicted nucleotidyltransferase